VLRERVEAEDIWGDVVRLRRGCIAGRVYGRLVQLEARCRVEEVEYTEELQVEPGCRINKPPVKVSQLPEPPL